MPSSAVRTFTDPDEFAASILGANVDLTIQERGHFRAKLVRINLGRLQMRRLSDDLPRIAHSTDIPGQAVVSFRTQPGPNLVRDGVEMSMPNLIWRGSESSHFQKSEGFAMWGVISLPVEQLTVIGGVFAGCDLTPPDNALSVTPASAAMAKLRSLHAAVGDLAEHASAVITHPEAARGLEQALIEAMVACLSGGEVDEDRAALRQHTAIMRKFYDVIEQHLDQPVYIPELCAEVGASERTLRICCQEQLGMSPKRYLLLRRLRMTRRALRESAPTETTVTEIATRYGFWQFGRFAGVYKELFGESPSIMLARAPEQSRSTVI
jgi:AraC-like DNA-binding protein